MLRRTLLVSFIVLVLLGGALLLTDTTKAQSPVDLNGWCLYRGHANGAVLNGSDAYSWQCEDSDGTRHGISVEDACQVQYGPSWHQHLGDFNDPYSWGCVQDAQPEPTQVPPPAPTDQSDPPPSDTGDEPGDQTDPDGETNPDPGVPATPVPPSAPSSTAVSSVDYQGNCTWHVYIGVEGFTPGATLYSDLSGTETACSGATNSVGWTNWEMGTIGSDGKTMVAVIHQGYGSYSYQVHDSSGRSASVAVSYGPPDDLQPTAIPPTPIPPTSAPPTADPLQAVDLYTNGGINMSLWCRQWGHVGAVIVEQTLYGWACEDAAGSHHAVSVEDACQTQFGLEYHQAMGDFEDPYDWYCLTVGQTVHDDPAPTEVPDPGPAFDDERITNRPDRGGCEIKSFTMSPSGPYVFGEHVHLEVQSTCGTVKFVVDGLNKAEIGSTDQVETWKTNETSSGRVIVCAHGRGDGGWDNGPRVCYSVYVGPQWRVDDFDPNDPEDDNDQPRPDPNCPSASAKLSVGNLAVVNTASLNVRSDPYLGATIHRNISHGKVVSVISGPQCHDGYRWWEIGDSGWSGWAAEVGSNNDYLLLPNGADIGNSDDDQASDPEPNSTPRPTAYHTSTPRPPRTPTEIPDDVSCDVLRADNGMVWVTEDFYFSRLSMLDNRETEAMAALGLMQWATSTTKDSIVEYAIERATTRAASITFSALQGFLFGSNTDVLVELDRIRNFRSAMVATASRPENRHGDCRQISEYHARQEPQGSFGYFWLGALDFIPYGYLVECYRDSSSCWQITLGLEGLSALDKLR